MIQTTCRRCGAVTHQVDGALMAGYRPRCMDCGQARLIPFQDVLDVEPDVAGAVVRAAAPEGQDDSGSGWRERRLTQLAGTCNCGGRFTTDAPLRCPSCRSTELDVEHEGSAD